MNNENWEQSYLKAGERLVLLPTESISIHYELSEEYKVKLHSVLHLLQHAAVGTSSHQQALTTLDRALEILDRVEELPNTKPYTQKSTLAIPLAQWEIEDYDNYFDVQHLQTERPAKCLLRSAIVTYRIFVSFQFCPQAIAKIDPLLIWKRFHWLFFVFIQGTIVSLLRFENNIESDNINQAGIELETIADLMYGSGVAMKWAGKFNQEAYQNQVRPSMVPPQVSSSKFSGLMSCDHAYLVALWKRNNTHMKTLPDSLQNQHEKLICAYEFLVGSHTAICEKFGGGEAGSLRSQGNTAVDILTKIARARRQPIDPKRRSTVKCLHHQNESEKPIRIGVKSYADLLYRVIDVPAVIKSFRPIRGGYAR